MPNPTPMNVLIVGCATRVDAVYICCCGQKQEEGGKRRR